MNSGFDRSVTHAVCPTSLRHTFQRHWTLLLTASTCRASPQCMYSIEPHSVTRGSIGIGGDEAGAGAELVRQQRWRCVRPKKTARVAKRMQVSGGSRDVLCGESAGPGVANGNFLGTPRPDFCHSR